MWHIYVKKTVTQRECCLLRMRHLRETWVLFCQWPVPILSPSIYCALWVILKSVTNDLPSRKLQSSWGGKIDMKLNNTRINSIRQNKLSMRTAKWMTLSITHIIFKGWEAAVSVNVQGWLHGERKALNGLSKMRSYSRQEDHHVQRCRKIL